MVNVIKDKDLTEFMRLFDKLITELNIIATHERKVTKIRERMAEIVKDQDA